MDILGGLPQSLSFLTLSHFTVPRVFPPHNGPRTLDGFAILPQNLMISPTTHPLSIHLFHLLYPVMSSLDLMVKRGQGTLHLAPDHPYYPKCVTRGVS